MLGARNLGGAILDHLVTEGWRGAAVARSEETAAAVRERGALGSPPTPPTRSALESALIRVREELGPPSLIVNAVSAARPPGGGPFGGGAARRRGPRRPSAAGPPRWPSRASCSSRPGCARCGESGGGTLVQVTGGSARRAMPGRGLWSAGGQATRAMVHAAAQEVREEGIHVALLIVDATIESPKTEAFTRDQPREALGDQRLIAEAVSFLAGQEPRAYTHELMVTPAGDRWVP